jgi:aminodeoxyfutalosine deaminase
VTINTDDPAMFGTDLTTEYAIAARLLDLDERGLTELALAAVDASFATPETRAARCAPKSAPMPRCQLLDRDCRLSSRCL